MEVHNKKSLLEIRRALRKEATPAEYVLWQHVRNGKLNGLKYKRQHSIGNYIVDFYCASERLIIELDGEVHTTKDQQEKDQFRDENLRDMGFTVLRFTNQQLLSDVDEVKNK
ncbi:MAG TPA: endonuclease domain-containing protein [Bacteroidia bacterium]|jgi:very-short-patch-repair endonuclease